MKVEGRKRSPTDALACKGKVSIVEHIQDLGDQIIEDELGDAISCDYEMAEMSTSALRKHQVCDMSSNLQAEGLCLRFPENLPPHANFSHELAVQMLGRAISLATQVAFQPSYIDKPPGTASPQPHPSLFSDAVADGQIYLLFIPGGVNFPLDGIRYMEHEQRYAIPLPAGRVRD